MYAHYSLYLSKSLHHSKTRLKVAYGSQVTQVDVSGVVAILLPCFWCSLSLGRDYRIYGSESKAVIVKPMCFSLTPQRPLSLELGYHAFPPWVCLELEK
jgi:hypothetical protein